MTANWFLRGFRPALPVYLLILLFCLIDFAIGREYFLDPSADSAFAEARELYRQEQFPAAAMAFSQLIVDFPWEARITIFMLYQGKALYYGGLFRESHMAFERLIRNHPASSYNAAAYYFLGRIFCQAQNYDSAAQAFLTAYERAPDSKQARLYRDNLSAIITGYLTAEQSLEIGKRVADQELAMEAALTAAEDLFERRQYERAVAVLDDFQRKYPEAAQDKRFAAAQKRLEFSASQRAVIALFAPITGELGGYGRMMANAFELAVTHFLEENPISLEQRTFDTFGNAIMAAIDARRLTIQPVSAIIGPLSSSEAVGVAAYADIAGIPMVCPTASEKGLTALADLLFQLAPTPEKMGQRMAEFLIEEIGLDSVAVLAPLDNYGRSITDGFVNAYTAAGKTIFYQQFYPRGTRDFRRFILDLKEELLPAEFDPEIFINDYGDTMEVEEIPLRVPAIFMPSYASELKLLLPQLRFYKIATVLLGSDSYGEQEITAMDETRDNPIFFVSRSLFLPEDTLWLRFNYEYQKRYDEKPDEVAAATYDAVNLVLDCIRQGMTSNREIQRCFLARGEYHGVSGIIRFGAQRENIHVPVYFLSEGKIMRLD